MKTKHQPSGHVDSADVALLLGLSIGFGIVVVSSSSQGQLRSAH